MSKLKTLKETECACERCSNMCTRPCWGTPKEINKLINLGYGDRLMLDFWGGSGKCKDIEILCGAIKGREGRKSGFWPRDQKGCTFWNDGLCDLHSKKLKPIEGRLANCETVETEDDDGEPSVHEEVAKLWNTEYARKVVAKWKKGRDWDKEEEDDEDIGMDDVNACFSRLRGLIEHLMESCPPGICEELMGKKDAD